MKVQFEVKITRSDESTHKAVHLLQLSFDQSNNATYNVAKYAAESIITLSDLVRLAPRSNVGIHTTDKYSSPLPPPTNIRTKSVKKGEYEEENPEEEEEEKQETKDCRLELGVRKFANAALRLSQAVTPTLEEEEVEEELSSLIDLITSIYLNHEYGDYV